MSRDAAWDALEQTARRINDDDASSEFTVVALRRRHVNRWAVREGLHLGNLWADVFEDVRTRRFLSDKWSEVQSISSAEGNVRDFIRRLSDPPDSNGESLVLLRRPWREPPLSLSGCGRP